MALARDDSHWLNGVPKNGTAVPNRVFVGGISGNTKEDDLTNLFSKFGNVRSTKIIVDKAGISKGYGFVTFDTEEEAQKVLDEVQCVTLKDRKLNIAPAVKKQPYNRNAVESSAVPTTPLLWPTQPYTAASGFSRDPVYYPQNSWPVVWPSQFYLHQQCNYPQAQGSYQYVYSIAPDYPLQAMGSLSDYSDNSSADNEGLKTRTKISQSDQERNRQSQAKPSPRSPQRSSSSSSSVDAAAAAAANHMPSTPIHPLHAPVFAKTVNGVTVMAYPGPFVMGSPALVHVRESESENVLTELGFLHGALTPPPTPLASLSCEFNANTSIETLRKN